VDPTDNPVPNQILQPILLASRKSCHWEGNEYLQTGNHYFTFSITSHQPGCMNGSNFGRASNEKLLAVWADNTFTTAVLPETQSFFNIDREGVLISTVKKAEDSDEIVMRVTELEGIDKTLEITCFKKIEGASLTNLIEENMKDLSVKNGKLILDLGHHSVETLKFN
jgi:alpha-mannosidase